jgi:hypothetical protein
MKKVIIFVVLATALTGCLQSQPEPASVPESAAEPEKVDLQKLVDQFDISPMFDWLKGYRVANKDSEAGE